MLGAAGQDKDIPRATVVESCVDYLTATSQHADNSKDLWALGWALFHDEIALGYDPRPFSWLGYEGLGTKHVTIARRDDGAMLRLSERAAHEHWQQAVNLAESVSRIDFAVTARFPEYIGTLAQLSYVTSRAYANARGEKLRSKLILSDTEGSTLYLGKRTSDLFARLYDKDRESNDPRFRNCWRWELEIKHEKGKYAAELLAKAPDPEVEVRGTVFHHFVTRGVVVPWRNTVSRGLPPAPARDTDDERRLRWLREQVAPVVGKLLGRIPKARVVKALGVNDVASGDTDVAAVPGDDSV